jgi:hypothetical protein
MWLGRNRKVSNRTAHSGDLTYSLSRPSFTPKRNVWPALVVALTGFAMSGHEQENMLSTNVCLHSSL